MSKKNTTIKNGDAAIVDDDGDVVLDEHDDAEELPASDASLAARILWVRDRVAVIGKDTQVGTQYKAISHDKVTGYLRPKLVQAGIFHWTTCIEHTDIETGQVTDAGRKITQHRAVYAVTFESVHDKQDCRTLNVVAYADDYGDKAPGKGLSYATKYALLKICMIETGEEDEERTADDPGSRVGRIIDDEKMLTTLFDVAEELFGDDASRTLKAMAARRFFVESYGDIPQDRFDDALRALRVSKKQIDESKARHGGDDESG